MIKKKICRLLQVVNKTTQVPSTETSIEAEMLYGMLPFRIWINSLNIGGSGLVINKQTAKSTAFRNSGRNYLRTIWISQCGLIVFFSWPGILIVIPSTRNHSVIVGRWIVEFFKFIILLAYHIFIWWQRCLSLIWFQSWNCPYVILWICLT